MSRITKFDRPACKLLVAEIQSALQAVASAHGLKVAYQGGRFEDHRFNPKIEFSVVSEGGTNEAAKQDWNRWRNVFGMPKVEFGAVFTNRQGSYAICGVKPRSRKFPVLAKRVDTGKVFKFQEDDVARWLGVEPRKPLFASHDPGVPPFNVSDAESRMLARAAKAEAKHERDAERRLS